MSFFIFISSLFSLSALDFGISLNQNAAVYNSDGSGVDFEYNAVLTPRLSFLAGKSGAVFISAALNFGYKDGFYYVPELLRTEYSANWGAWGFRVGRVNYADSAGFIAGGLFDGLHFTHSSRFGRFGLGLWYTGFQYKKSANITMTGDDLALYNAPLDYANFAHTYFAPRRILASVDWEHLSLFGFMRLKTALLGQMELSRADEKLHTQYFSLKTGVRVKSVLIELGGTLGTAQAISKQETKFNLSLAGDLGVFWTLPTSFDSRLSLTAMFAGGKTGGFAAFVPVSTKYHSEIFRAKMTALTVAALGYTARLSGTFGTDITASYFIRNDLETLNTYPVSGAGNDGHFLGGEIYARVIWSPFSDLQVNLGGGVFLPVLGNNWSDESPLWRVNLSVIIAY